MQTQYTKNLTPQEIWIGYNTELANLVYVFKLTTNCDKEL